MSDIRHKALALYILPVKRFARQMRWLKSRGYQPISLDTLYDYLARGGPIPAKPVVITFDDGYRELKDTATPLLADMGFCHTHFLNPGKLGGATDWIAAAPDLPILGGEEVRALLAAYGKWVDFQAHGKTHLSLKHQDPETIRAEIGDSIADIESLLQRPVTYFAYPYGDHDETAVRTAAGMALRCAFTVEQGLCRPGQNLFRLPRVEILGNDFFLDFICKVRFGWSPIARLRTILKRIYKKIMRRFA
ncbi:MAG: polysaccharide deacetylase family protein [Nitrospinales bacterium]